MINTQIRNDILESLAKLLAENKQSIIEANKADIAACPTDDLVIFDRLKVDDAKVDKMIASVENVIAAPDPVGKIIAASADNDGNFGIF